MTHLTDTQPPRLQVYESGSGTPTEYLLTKTLTTLGRQSSNTISFPIRGISRYHARIERTKESHTITDLNSFNGTFVNGQRLTAGVPHVLQNGDVIHLGKVDSQAPRLIYQATPATSVKTPPPQKSQPSLATPSAESAEPSSEQIRPPFTNSWAVVIGIDNYTNGIPKLRTAVNDASRLWDILKDDFGYQVLPLLVDEKATAAHLSALLTKALPKLVQEDDQVLFYFAGHGIALEGSDGPDGYLVPADAQPGNRDTYLPMTFLHDQLLKLPCRHMLLVLDCCFAGAMRWAATRDVLMEPTVVHRERYERYVNDPAWQVITSAAYDEKALDVLDNRVLGERGEDEGDHSPFAALLFDALAGAGDIIPAGQEDQPGGDGIITASELYLYLRDYVGQQAETQFHRQTPGLWPLKKHDKGEYIFLLPTYDESKLPPAPELSLDNNPYRGLEAYEEEHAELFFGREQVIKQLREKVEGEENPPLTVVVGASGTGKSSLVKAGLIPKLGGIGPADLRNAPPHSAAADNEDDQWYILPPTRPTESPVAMLINWLNTHLPPPASVSFRGGQNFTLKLDGWRKENPTQKILLMIDQFEEVITLCHDAAERAQFMALLAQILTQAEGVVQLIITVRSDFEPQLVDLALKRYWEAARFVIPPLSVADLEEIIEGPAAVRVLYFEPSSLVDKLVNEVIQTPGALPLLSFTLSELYIKYLQRRSDNRALTEEDYVALGGVIGALRSRAKEEYDALDAAHQETMRRMMLRMVSAEGGELARRRVLLSELVYDDPAENKRVKLVQEKLVNARLLVRGTTDENEPYIEPAHDALVRAWDQLLSWMHEAEEYLSLQRRLTQAAADWRKEKDAATREKRLWHNDARLPQIENYLLYGEQNYSKSTRQRAGQWVKDLFTSAQLEPTIKHWLNKNELTFIRASFKQRRKSRRRLVGTIATIFTVLVALVIFAGIQTVEAQAQANAAAAAESTAQAEATRALAAEADAQEQAATAIAAQGTAEAERDRANRSDADLVVANQELEEANQDLQGEIEERRAAEAAAINAQGTAEAEATRAFEQQQAAETAATRAFEQQSIAQTEAARAIAAQSTAEAEATRSFTVSQNFRGVAQELLPVVLQASVVFTDVQAIEGPVLPQNPAWVTLLENNTQPILISREYGAGQIIAAGHDIFLRGEEDLLDATELAFSWLGGGDKNISILVSTGHCEWDPEWNRGQWGNTTPTNLDIFRNDPLITSLNNWGYQQIEIINAPLDDSKLVSGSILLIGNAWGTFTGGEIEAVERFVSNGGKLYVVGLGWSWLDFGPERWCADSPEIIDLDNYPMNRLVEPYDMAWIDGS